MPQRRSRAAPAGTVVDASAAGSAVIAAPAPSRPLPRSFLPALVLAGLAGNMVGALGTPLVPTVGQEYGVSLDSAQWTLTISLLVGVVLTPVIGRMADGGARRRLLIRVVLLIILGGVLAAVAPSFALVMVGRGLQGLGYAIVPLAVGIAREHLSGPKLTSSLIALSLSLSVGSGIGNPAVGLIVRASSYHGAFWFAAGVTLVSLLWILVAVPKDSPGTSRVSFDVAGAIVLSLSLSAILLGVTRGVSLGWTSPAILGLLGAGAALLALWIVLELRIDEPLVDLRLALHRSIMAANLSSLLLGMGMFMMTSLISRLVQTPTTVPYGLGGDTFTSGMLLLASSLGSLVSQPITTVIARRLGLASVLPLGGLIMSGALVLMAFEHGSLAWLGVVMVLCGVGMGMTFAITPALIVANVPGERAASATGLNTLIRLLGGALGSALSGVILQVHTPVGAQFPDQRGYVVGCLIAAGFGLATAISGAILVRGGRAQSERERAELERAEQGEPELGIANADGTEAEAIAAATAQRVRPGAIV